MGRIRSIKPQINHDAKAAALPDDAWRLWVASWPLADDDGRLPAHPAWLGGQIFWAKPDPTAYASRALASLRESSLVEIYEVRGEVYMRICGFHRHQKIDRPSPPKYPAPNEGVTVPDGWPLASPREPSRALDAGLGSGGEWDRETEGKERSELRSDASPRAIPPTPAPDTAVNARSHASFAQERSEVGPHPTTGETPKTPPGANGEASAKAGRAKRTKPEPPAEAMTAALVLMERITTNHPESKLAQAAESDRIKTAARWADSIRLLHEQDKITWGAIQAMIEWSQRHSFWRGVILSGDNLRDKWDKMAAQRSQQNGRAGSGPDPREGAPTANGHVRQYGRFEPKPGSDYSAPWDAEDRDPPAAPRKVVS